MANLADLIRCEIEKGNLNEIFTVQEVTSLAPSGDNCRICDELCLIKSVREILANHSIGPGYRRGESVKRGQQILFVKHDAKATYSLLEEDDEDEWGEQGNQSYKAVETGDTLEHEEGEGIARKFVDYIREKPYRIFIGRGVRGNWYPRDGSVTGWNNRLQAYQWKGANWASTLERVDVFINNLCMIRNERLKVPRHDLNERAETIYNNIREWGNPRGVSRQGSFVMARLGKLWGDGRVTQVDSTLTKLYAFADPDNYVIYDSRVAAAIVSIAEDIFRYRTVNGRRQETVNRVFHPSFPALGAFPGAGGTRPRASRWAGWPDSDRNVTAQYDANRLCLAMVHHLNDRKEDGRADWSLREVEAVLFMEGY